jgi:hypothetical protein
MSDFGPTMGERILAQAMREERRRRVNGVVLFLMTVPALGLSIILLTMMLIERL